MRRWNSMEIEEYLSGFVKFTNKPSLEAMKWLLKEFGNPQDTLTVIHVAGTNGKGSVCEMLNNILIKAGYCTGKFISPHLITFHETICINNEPIKEEDIQSILVPLAKKIEEYNQTHEIRVTWFEVITAIALIYFKKKQCQIAIIETGMGGTHDCTNVVHSILSIITNIGYDHMEVLGNTLEKIASNKAGIIKQNGDTIFIKQLEEIDSIIEEKCKKENNNLHLLDASKITNYRYDKEYQQFNYQQEKDICVNLKGKKQTQNAMVCIEAVTILNEKGFSISKEAMREGLKTVIHPARFEVLGQNPTIIFDGGHNEKAIQNLKETIAQYYGDSKKLYIISILNTKDYKTIISQLVEDEEAVYLFTSGNDSKRYVEKEELLKEANKQEKGSYKVLELEEAIELANREYADRTIFIVGSFYVYETVLKKLKEIEETK